MTIDSNLKINQKTLKLFNEASKKNQKNDLGGKFLNVLNSGANLNKIANNEYIATQNIINNQQIKNINLFNNNRMTNINPDMTIDTKLKNNKDISDSIVSGVRKKINSIKSIEERINTISSSDDIDSLDLVTSVHNLELEFKQLNMYATKIVDSVKSILYNTQV